MLLFIISKLIFLPAHRKLINTGYNWDWLWRATPLKNENSRLHFVSIMLKFQDAIWCMHLRYACSYTYIHVSYCTLQALGVKKRGVEGMSRFRFAIRPTNYQTKPERLFTSNPILLCVIPASAAHMIPTSDGLTCFERSLWGSDECMNNSIYRL
jgi:hypothetical protein